MSRADLSPGFVPEPVLGLGYESQGLAAQKYHWNRDLHLLLP